MVHTKSKSGFYDTAHFLPILNDPAIAHFLINHIIVIYFFTPHTEYMAKLLARHLALLNIMNKKESDIPIFDTVLY